MNVNAATVKRSANLKSHGVFVGHNNNNSKEVVLDSSDLYYLADQLDVLDKTIQGLSLKSNASISYTYHAHKKGDGTKSSSTLYATSNPGGCYKAFGHTHNKTGTCGTKYTTHVHNGSCATKVVTTTTKCGGPMNQISAHDYGSFVARQYQCFLCGTIIRHEAARWEEMPPPLTVCTEDKVSKQTVYACNNAPLNTGMVYTCGSPTNTWTVQCGKSTSSIDEAHIVFN